MKQRKLQNFLIKPGVQLRLTFKFLLIAVVLFFISAWLAFTVIWPVIEGFVPTPLQEQLLRRLIFKFAISSIPLLVLFIAAGIVITHRIAGILSRIEQTLTRLSEGKSVMDIRIRRKDELQELVQKLNIIIAEHQKKNVRKKNTDALWNLIQD